MVEKIRTHHKRGGRPPQYSPAPCKLTFDLLTFWPWKWCLSHVWRGLPLWQF